MTKPSKPPMDENFEYTPITDFSGLGRAISQIKTGQERANTVVSSLDRMVRHEVKPKLDEVRDGFIRLETEHKTTKARLKTLESDTKVLSSPKPHDCYHEDDIKENSEEIRAASMQVAKIAKDVAKVATQQDTSKESFDKDVGRIEGRSRFISGAAITIALFVLGGAGTASVTLYTMQANVSHLSEEQTKIRTNLAGMARSNDKTSTTVQQAADRVTEVAEKVEKNGNHHQDPLELVWCDLSPQERRRQQKLRGHDNVPRKVCEQ